MKPSLRDQWIKKLDKKINKDKLNYEIRYNLIIGIEKTMRRLFNEWNYKDGNFYFYYNYCVHPKEYHKIVDDYSRGKICEEEYSKKNFKFLNSD